MPLSLPTLLCALLATAAAVPALAGPLAVSTSMMVEKRAAASDGTTKLSLVKANAVVPGDRVVMVLAYRNTGTQPIADLVLANPVPRGLVYQAPNPGSASPDLSVDGKIYGPLSALRIAVPGGGTRAAGPTDVTSVRWRLASPLQAGSQGQLAFQAVLK